MNHAKHVIPMSDTSASISPEDIQPTVLPDAFIQSDIVRKLNTLSLPRYNQLPNVTLYRDQVIEYIELCGAARHYAFHDQQLREDRPGAGSGKKAIWPRADCSPYRHLYF